MLSDLRKEIDKLKDPKRAKSNEWFFKTGKGEYGYGDKFVGLTVPNSRKIAKKFRNLSFTDIKTLLGSKIHEERLIALLVLVENFAKGDRRKRKSIYGFYLANTKHVNNWDLVDLSAHKIIGRYLFDKGKGIKVLLRLARSENLWERRISVLSTFWFINKEKYEEALEIAEKLVTDDHDLIHKAVGWMLREIGKRDLAIEEKFLKKHYKQMPRTMLRYAIERFPEKKRQGYLKGEV